jgi:hypothetical protein
MTAHAGSIPQMIDLDATPVQGQVASTVLDLSGNFLRGNIPPQDANILFQMLIESASLPELKTDALYRLTVNFASIRYVVARDDYCVYIVQTRS